MSWKHIQLAGSVRTSWKCTTIWLWWAVRGNVPSDSAEYGWHLQTQEEVRFLCRIRDLMKLLMPTLLGLKYETNEKFQSYFENHKSEKLFYISSELDIYRGALSREYKLAFFSVVISQSSWIKLKYCLLYCLKQQLR